MPLLIGLVDCSESKTYKVLLVARLSLRRDTRSRLIANALADTGIYRVTSISETSDYAANTTDCLGNVRTREVRLLLPGKSLWHIAGALRVLQMNVIGSLEVLKGQHDIVICGDVPYCLPGVLAKSIYGRKFVFDSHEIIWSTGMNQLLSSTFKVLERLILRYCDLWLVASDDRACVTMQHQRLTRPYVVLENFPVFDPAAPMPTGYSQKVEELRQLRKLVVMYQGRLLPRRGIEQLVQAACTSGFHLVIQGSGPLLHAIERHENMTVLEPCSNNEVVSWLGLADLSFVYYENVGLNYAYACSSKFYASVFAGIPVLANHLPAFEDFAGRYGGVIFFDSLTPESIREAIISVANSPERLDTLKAEMRSARDQWLQRDQRQVIVRAFDQMMKSSEQ